MIAINTLYVTVTLSRWGISNEEGIFESERRHLYSGTYGTTLSTSDFEEKLIRTILSHKGDGLDLNIQTTKIGVYVDIELLIDEKDADPNIDYLVDFLESFHSELEKQEQVDSLPDFERYIYFQCFSPQELEILTKEFKKKNIETEVVSETRKTFEKGAGSFFMAYIIGIASTASWDAGKKLLKKIRKKHDIHFMKVQTGSIDTNSLIENVSQSTGINQQDLDLISFEEVEKRRYEVWLRNRYKTIVITSNAQGYISNLKIYERSQTHI